MPGDDEPLEEMGEPGDDTEWHRARETSMLGVGMLVQLHACIVASLDAGSAWTISL